MTFWIFAKVYGMRERIVPPDPWFRSLMSVVTLEAGLIVGATLLLGGLGLAAYALGTWAPNGLVRSRTRRRRGLSFRPAPPSCSAFRSSTAPFLSASSRSGLRAPPKARCRTARPKRLSRRFRASPLLKLVDRDPRPSAGIPCWPTNGIDGAGSVQAK